jgi:Glycosyl transferase family 2
VTGKPAMSVVLVTPDRFETLRTTVRQLRAQQGRERLELVVVAPSEQGLELEPGELDGFSGARVVELGEVRSVAAGNAAGVRAASAPVVAFGEDHCFPASGWATALIEAHRSDWAVVGPAVANANPGTAVSWADFLLGYGPWAARFPGGVVEYLPGHNSAYKRERLLEFDGELERMLDAECVLHWELGRRGHQLFLDPAARTFHFNFSRLGSWLAAIFFLGRTFASRRAQGENWSRARRLAFILASPLIPAVRGARALRDLRRIRPGAMWTVRVLPALVVGLLANALGEALGYAIGPGNAPERISAYEFHRERHLVARDRAAMSTWAPSPVAERRR